MKGERVWHPSQKLRELRVGGVELTFTCGESFEIASWVASWREWVVAVAPTALRSELAQFGQTLVRRYG
jgi:WYL domain